jgi:hypothetical protein
LVEACSQLIAAQGYFGRFRSFISSLYPSVC